MQATFGFALLAISTASPRWSSWPWVMRRMSGWRSSGPISAVGFPLRKGSMRIRFSPVISKQAWPCQVARIALHPPLGPPLEKGFGRWEGAEGPLYRGPKAFYSYFILPPCDGYAVVRHPLHLGPPGGGDRLWRGPGWIDLLPSDGGKQDARAQRLSAHP